MAMANSRIYACLSGGFAGLCAFSFLVYQSCCLTFTWFLHPENLLSMLIFVTSLISVNPLPYVFNVDIELINLFFPLVLAAVKFHFIFGCNGLQCTGEERSTAVAFALFLGVYTILNVFATVFAEQRVIEGGSSSRGWLSMRPLRASALPTTAFSRVAMTASIFCVVELF
jgi:hypothetical protein